MDAPRPSGSDTRATSSELARTCRRCGIRFTGGEVAVMFTRSARECRECIRARRAPTHWAVTKAQNTLRLHAERAGLSVAEFAASYGWAVGRIAVEMERAMAAGCHYGDHTYGEPRELTVDIVYPDRPPYWITNTRVCCLDCNRKKQRMGGDEWALRVIAVERRARAYPIQIGLWDEAA